MWEQFVAMWHGQGHLRVLVQPLLAILLGVLQGRRDAHERRAPFGVTLARAHGGERWHDLAAAARRIAVPLVMAVTLSIAFQWINLRKIHPIGSLLFALLFVALPYAAARGLANRVSRHRPAPPTRGPATTEV